MAEIPSDIASSAAQTGFRARETAKDHDGPRAAQAVAADRQTKAVDEAGSTVDTADNDTQIYPDAEGTGSQGRPFEEENGQEDETPAEASNEGITRDDQGNVHLDLEA